MSELPKVKDVMTTSVVTVHEDEPATKARALFREYGYRSFPVVDSEGRLIGIITRGDIMRITSSRSNILVGGLMSTSVDTALPEESILDAARKMIRLDVERLPVVASATDSTLCGIISAHDIIKALLESGHEPIKKRVADIMTTEVVTCSYDDPVTKVWAKMDDTGFSGIPVVKNGEIIGIITRKDIIDSGFARISREDDKGKARNPPSVEKVMTTPAVTVYRETDVREAGKIMVEKYIGRLPVVENKKVVGIIDRDDVMGAWLPGV